METLQQNASPFSIVQPCETPSFSEYCKQWLLMIRPKVKDSSYARYHGQITNHIIPFLGSYCGNKLTEEVMTSFSLFLTENQGLSSKTQKDVLVLLTSVLKYAGKFEPEYLRLLPQYPRVVQQEMRVLSRYEQKKLTDYLLQDMDSVKFGILLSLLTGMRIGEICALKWSHISIRDGKILVRFTMQRIPTENNTGGCRTRIIITTPKTEKSLRTISMSELVVNLCKKWIVRIRKHMCLPETSITWNPERYSTGCADILQIANWRVCIFTLCGIPLPQDVWRLEWKQKF